MDVNPTIGLNPVVGFNLRLWGRVCKDIFRSNLTAVEIEAVLRWGFDKCVFFFEALQPFCDVRWIDSDNICSVPSLSLS